MKMSPSLRGVLASLVLTVSLHAEVRLANFFSEGMVLQRERSVPIWGFADYGETVTVEFGGQIKHTITNAQRRWFVTLDAMPASATPRSLRVVGSNNTLRVGNILVGDVWFCSGQSNMAWTVAQVANATTEIANAHFPQIREYAVPKEFAYEPVEDVAGRWTWCSPSALTTGTFSGTAYYFGRELHQRLGVPIGLINSSNGGTPVEAWMDYATLEADPNFPSVLSRWEDRCGTKTMPTGLYNAMVHPFVPAALRGVIWYQGEANTAFEQEYRSLFPSMIRGWRSAFGQGDLPFYFVQLPNYSAGGDPNGLQWARLREAQMQALALAGTGMAVTIELGENDNIHPANKQDVGRRLALAALAQAYGLSIEGSGPRFERAVRTGAELSIEFSHADGLHRISTPQSGFEIAGYDRVFQPAEFRIEGSRVVVALPSASFELGELRYAWRNVPSAPLYNSAELPASPFRLVYNPADAIAPIVLTAPQSQTVMAGQSAVFTVGAGGTDPFAYLWKKDGVALGNAQAPVLSLASVRWADRGTYTVEVSNAAGLVTSSPAILTVQTGYRSYLAEYFSTGELADEALSSAAADPDGDGLGNLLEFALGLNPRVADAEGEPLVALTDGRLTISYLRRLGALDLSYAVEVSDNLQTWQSGAPWVEEVAVTPWSAEFELVTVRDATPVTATHSRFIRLRVNVASEL